MPNIHGQIRNIQALRDVKRMSWKEIFLKERIKSLKGTSINYVRKMKKNYLKVGFWEIQHFFMNLIILFFATLLNCEITHLSQK